MLPADRLRQITERFEYLEARLNAGPRAEEIAAISREYAELKPVVEQIAAFHDLQAEIEEAEALLDDPEMAPLAEEELPRLRKALPKAEQALQIALLPRDEADARPAMIEIRPGTGGDEAALFAGDLLRMYQRYAEARGWRFEIIEEQLTELGGIKELVGHVTGENVRVCYPTQTCDCLRQHGL